MRFVTWNLDGLNDRNVDERTEAAVFTAILGARLDQVHEGTKPTPPPDVILFQEVVERTFHAHIDPHLTAGGYTVLPPEAPKRQTFEIVAFRKPFEVRSYDCVPLRDSTFGRQLHVADLISSTIDVRVLTAHCDSGTDARSIRIAQLRQIADALNEAGCPGVFGGDTNLRKAEWLDVRGDLSMTDAWEALGEPPSTRVTWRRDTYKARFDRVFLSAGFVARSMDPLGSDRLPVVDVPISDHIGLLVEAT